MKWFLHCVKYNYANFNGRASREEYWMFVLFKYLFLVAVLIISALVSGIFGSDYRKFFMYGAILYIIALLIPSLAVSTRRLHDTNKSGWLLALNFIPYVNAISGLIIFIFTCTDGDPYPNNYGGDPKGRGNREFDAAKKAETQQIIEQKQQALSQRDNGQPEYEIAMSFYNGTNDIAEQSFSKAVIHLKEASAKGHAQAKEVLATCFYNGDGVEQSYQEAVKLWEELANNGNANAQYNLGLSYYQGKGVEKDNETAISYLRPACENFNDNACSLLNRIKKENENNI